MKDSKAGNSGIGMKCFRRGRGEGGLYRWPGRRALQSTLKGHVSEPNMKRRVTNKDRLSFQRAAIPSPRHA